MQHEHNKSEDSEIRKWKRNLVGAWVFTFPIAVLMIFTRIFGIELMDEGWMILITLILGFPVIFIFGWHTIKYGLKGLFTFYFGMDSLIALGTVIAYLTGIFTFFNVVADYSGVDSID